MLDEAILALAPAVFGGAVWRRNGAPWRVILSWTVPVTVLEVAGWFLAGGILRIVLVGAALALFAAMMLWPAAGVWWARNIARRLEVF